MVDNARAFGRVLTGTIVSISMQKTVVVQIQESYVHPVYKKSIRRTRTIAAQNTSPDINVGDTVRIAETKPISKTKHFKVVEKIR